MITQTRKPTKAQRLHELFTRIEALGFTFEEAQALRRIEMTLHRWAEAECNGEIERDEKTDRPLRRYANYMQEIADREKGALKRLGKIVGGRNMRMTEAGLVWVFHQTDPRGCALYIGLDDVLPKRENGMPDSTKLDQIYTRGLAVCA